jgi:hypothetical protein
MGLCIELYQTAQMQHCLQYLRSVCVIDIALDRSVIDIRLRWYDDNWHPTSNYKPTNVLILLFGLLLLLFGLLLFCGCSWITGG